MLLLMLKTAGTGSWPVSVPLKPIDTVPPFAPIVAFQDSAVTVTAWPVSLQVPSQPPWTASPAAGKLNVSVHGLIAAEPLSVMVIVAPNPPGQLLFSV